MWYLSSTWKGHLYNTLIYSYFFLIVGVLETKTDMPSLFGQFSLRQEVTFPGGKHTYGSDVGCYR